MPFQHYIVIANSLLWAFAFGACVGSFLNVIVYRLPAGISIISPPSRCPKCEKRLGWKENLPVLGWLMLRGKCRHCKAPISPQYLIVEAFVGLLFVILALTYYYIAPTTHPGVLWTHSFFGGIGGPWWLNGFIETSPAFIAILVLVSGLLAMTLIDARTFTIPIQIPVAITLAGFGLLTIQGVLPATPRGGQAFAIPTTDWQWFLVGVGGVVGVGLGVFLLGKGIFRYSFADYEEYLEKDEPLADYPHARREMFVELTFLLPVVTGLCIGYFVGMLLPATPPPMMIQALGGSLLGYIVGGGVVWAVRILGTFAFGREAIGLGDVHLLAAIGAVLGWQDPIWVFFIAPFSGLLWVAASIVLSSIFATRRRELPYGPHLAIATLIVILGRPGVLWVQNNVLFPGLYPPPPAGSSNTPAIPGGAGRTAGAGIPAIPGPSGIAGTPSGPGSSTSSTPR